MRNICAWCNRESQPPTGVDDHLISHDICPECRDKLLNGEDEDDDNADYQ